MTEPARLALAIEQTFTGPVWHGSALAALLTGVSADVAHARPIPDAHTIWELVLHLSAWAMIVELRVGLVRQPEVTDAADWPEQPASPTAGEWKAAVEGLREAHEYLARTVAQIDPHTLERRVPSRHYTLRDMLHGVPEHAAYHGGQIALLLRAR